MAAKMETLDPAALKPVTPIVTFDPTSDTVTLPGGLVSVAGVTVITGGVELSWGSCILAFGFWGTLIGLSCGAVGLFDQVNHVKGGISLLLGLGLVILSLSLMMVGGVVAFYHLTKKKRQITRTHRQEGREVLVGESGGKIKKVTV